MLGVRDRGAVGDDERRALAVATKRAEKLPQAILGKAFKGELVPTEADLARAEGRDYETAEQLLARVKAEREAGAKRGRSITSSRRTDD